MPTHDDLRDALRAQTDGLQPPPGLLDDVRRRRRRRLYQARAAVAALAVAAIFFTLPDGPDVTTYPALSTPPPTAEPAPLPTAMGLAKKVRFEGLFRLKTTTFTATGRDLVVVSHCQKLIVIINGDPYPCGERYRNWTNPGERTVIEAIAIPRSYLKTHSIDSVMNDLDGLRRHAPEPGTWSLDVHTGTCDAVTCGREVP
ncbi:hypothetical protein GCM10027589_40920 [Actinocorallia lasiicapitis]